MVTVEATIVGGGITGCAVADAAARAGFEVVLLEKEARLGAGVTSRNSEVAHGGMYYPPGSIKADCCVRGRRLLKVFCAEAGVAYRECGKLIVAVDDDEAERLDPILARGLANGVEDFNRLDADQLLAMEPDVKAVAGLWSPRTGIVDAEGAARAYADRAAEHGALLMTGTEVTALERRDGAWLVTARRGDETWTHASTHLVLCGGLHADDLVAMTGLDVDAEGLRQTWVKGNYFSIDPRHAGRVNRLVYPVPPRAKDTLGVHVCLDLGGQMRLGPDFEPVVRGVEDYAVDPLRLTPFYEGAVRFLPWLEPEDLNPVMSGIRPKLEFPGPFADFRIRRYDGEREGLVALTGIDSPGLTSSPAVGALVADVLGGGIPPAPLDVGGEA